MSGERRDDAPLRGPSAREQAELEALAEELREACPPPPLSDGFLARLDQRLAKSWTLRSAMDRSPALRVAAGLLVLLIAGAPVAALVSLLPGWPGERPDLAFDAPAPPPLVEEPAPAEQVPVVPPYDRDEWFTPEWRQALERANRMALAGASWSAAGMGAAEAPQVGDWSTADADALWREFRHRCATGDSLPPGPALEARIRALAGEGGDPRLAGWLWVLDGEAPDEARGWEGAPFVER